jgi:hypothetical protein
VTPFIAAGAGFLLAVLWFDLMFDVQVWPHRRGPDPVPARVLDSVGVYYARVTTAAHPMNRLVAVVMLATIGCVVAQVVDGDEGWAAWASLALVVSAVAVAAISTVPSAVRLGSAVDDDAGRSALARSVLRDHLFCFAAIASVLVIQLGFAS